MSKKTKTVSVSKEQAQHLDMFTKYGVTEIVKGSTKYKLPKKKKK